MVKGKTVLDSNVQFYCWKEKMVEKGFNQGRAIWRVVTLKKI